MSTCKKCGVKTQLRGRIDATPLERKYAVLMVYGKNKRIRKKAYIRLFDVVGYDGEGLRRYSRVANLMTEVKKHNPQKPKSLKPRPKKVNKRRTKSFNSLGVRTGRITVSDPNEGGNYNG